MKRKAMIHNGSEIGCKNSGDLVIKECAFESNERLVFDGSASSWRGTENGWWGKFKGGRDEILGTHRWRGRQGRAAVGGCVV